MTEQQKAALKAYILATPALAAIASGAATDYQAIANALNAEASPVVKAWRVSMPKVELVEASIDEIAAFDNLTAGKRDAWALFISLPVYDFSRNKVRSAVGKVWANAQRDAILTACLENAKVCEVQAGGSSVTEGGVTGWKRSFVGSMDTISVSEILA